MIIIVTFNAALKLTTFAIFGRHIPIASHSLPKLWYHLNLIFFYHCLVMAFPPFSSVLCFVFYFYFIAVLVKDSVFDYCRVCFWLLWRHLINNGRVLFFTGIGRFCRFVHKGYRFDYYLYCNRLFSWFEFNSIIICPTLSSQYYPNACRGPNTTITFHSPIVICIWHVRPMAFPCTTSGSVYFPSQSVTYRTDLVWKSCRLGKKRRKFAVHIRP